MSSAGRRPRRVGVVGVGALGECLVRAVAASDRLALAFAWNRSPARLDALVAEGLVPASARCEDLASFAAFSADLIVEVCHPDVLAAWGCRFLASGADFLCGSPTALADGDVLAALLAAAATARCGVFVPAGALWGAADIARMSERGTLAFLEVTMKKHPASLKLGGALGERLAAFVASDAPPGVECVLYEGPVRGLCPLAPNNVNTMAAAALAAHGSLGFDGVRAVLVADASLDAHVITIDARGKSTPGSSSRPFRAFTERYNPAPPGAVTGAATFASFVSSLLSVAELPRVGRGAGLHMC